MTTAALLTPPGTAAIAVIAVRGPCAWAIVRELLRTTRTLPEMAPSRHFYLGKIANDDVIVSLPDEDVIEIHCHGGARIVEHILQCLREKGCRSDHQSEHQANYWLARAPTLKTAGILLDQARGALARVIRGLLDDWQPEILDRLAAMAPLGRHLVEPWSVVLVGAPNVGKSTLMNAVAGFDRVLVSPEAGTTRDAVTTVVAFEGWPIALSDTAGLRNAEGLEAAGVERTRQQLARADIIIRVLDATESPPRWEEAREPTLVVANKCDLPEAVCPPMCMPISARTGTGIADLTRSVVRHLVPVEPIPGEAVPFTPLLAAKILEARTIATAGRIDAAREVLAACLSICD